MKTMRRRTLAVLWLRGGGENLVMAKEGGTSLGVAEWSEKRRTPEKPGRDARSCGGMDGERVGVVLSSFLWPNIRSSVPVPLLYRLPQPSFSLPPTRHLSTKQRPSPTLPREPTKPHCHNFHQDPPTHTLVCLQLSFSFSSTLPRHCSHHPEPHNSPSPTRAAISWAAV